MGLCCKKIFAMLLLGLSGCATGVPEGVIPVSGFELGRYLGKWHEIARLDHKFERGLTQVSAGYSMRDGGGVRVLNRGYDPAKKKWKEAEGRAYSIGDTSAGRLKVSFFRPFYGAYNIIELDKENYGYSLVCGPDRSYLWILARTPVLDAAILKKHESKAAALGFDAAKLIYHG